MAQAGSGVGRLVFLVESINQATRDSLVALVQELATRCQAIDGNLMIEQVPPELKRDLPVWGVPRGDLVVMKRIKQEMDPLGLFCPGRFVDGIESRGD